MLVGDVVLHVFAPPGDRGDGLPLLDLDELEQLDEDVAVVEALRESVAGLGHPSPLRPGWYAPTFLTEAQDWVDEVLAGLGRRRTSRLEPVQIWSLSAVLRAPYDGGVAYLKGCSPHFHAEPALTRVLAARLGDAVPRVLGTDDVRGWLLMDALPEGTADAVRAADVLARLQVNMAGHLDELVAAGAPDRGAAATLAAFEAVVETGIEIPRLTPSERDRLPALVPWIGDQLARMEGCGLPTTLVHGDLHTGNVASEGERLVVYDWSDACVGMPAVDLPVLSGRVEEGSRAAVHAAYADVWREHAPSADTDLAVSLAPVVCDAFQAVTYDLLARGVEPVSRWELEGATTRVLRQLLASHAAVIGDAG
jgi:hypothetical protein